MLYICKVSNKFNLNQAIHVSHMLLKFLLYSNQLEPFNWAKDFTRLKIIASLSHLSMLTLLMRAHSTRLKSSKHAKMSANTSFKQPFCLV